jgi:hypothetical protein
MVVLLKRRGGANGLMESPLGSSFSASSTFSRTGYLGIIGRLRQINGSFIA